MTVLDVEPTGETVSGPTDEYKEVTPANAEGEQEIGFFNIFDGTKGRPAGRYLDMDERIEAEKVRILRGVPTDGINDLDSDFGKLPPGAGTPVVTEAQRVDNSVMSNPATVAFEQQGLVKDVDPILTATVNVSEPEVDVDTTYVDQVSAEGGEVTAPDTGDGPKSPVADALDGTVTAPDLTADSTTSTSESKSVIVK